VSSDSSAAQYDYGGDITSVNSDGFSLGYYSGGVNYSGRDYATWTFRKAPKFFDVVTYTGNGSTQIVSHNLGSVPGMILIKCTSLGSTNWLCYHRGAGAGKFGYLNTTNSFFSNTSIWQNTTPTSTQFYLGGGDALNGSGQTYVAYLFAHNNGDGEFGPDGDQDIIKCGSYTGNAHTGQYINIGFEPQWLMIKRINQGSANWVILDTMRGLFHGDNPQALYANLTNAETKQSNIVVSPTATGFWLDDDAPETNEGSDTYIYMAIRRGPLAQPESGTEVFAIDTQGGTSPTPPSFTSGFPVDMNMTRININSGNQPVWLGSRLTSGLYLQTNSNSQEFSNSGYFAHDYNDGVGSVSGAQSSYYSWMWKRAPGFFDAVAYTGNSTSGRTVSHNLGVAPEMMWVKKRNSNSNSNWKVYHVSKGNNYHLFLNLTSQGSTGAGSWNNTTPTESVFTLGNQQDVNNFGDSYIAYLFATLPGVSKVGSYTGTGSTQTIDCGFTGGARFVLIKKVENGENWEFFDVDRGITSNATDKVLTLSANFQQFSETDWYGGNAIQPHTSGFQVVSPQNLNISSKQYIFYAVA
jgi:hypothetical protein